MSYFQSNGVEYSSHCVAIEIVTCPFDDAHYTHDHTYYLLPRSSTPFESACESRLTEYDMSPVNQSWLGTDSIGTNNVDDNDETVHTADFTEESYTDNNVTCDDDCTIAAKYAIVDLKQLLQLQYVSATSVQGND